MIRQAVALVGAQLRQERRSAEVALVVVPFGAVALLVIPIAVGIDTPLLARIGPGLFWVVVLLFGAFVIPRRDHPWDQARGAMLTLLGVDPAVRFVADATVAGILLLAFEFAMGAVTLFLYAPPVGDWPYLLLVLPLSAAGLGMVGSLAAAVSAGLGARTGLALLLVVPVSIPILVAGAQATESLRTSAGILRWILLLAIVDVLLALIAVLTSRSMEEL
jgi:heme exporter protein B